MLIDTAVVRLAASRDEYLDALVREGRRLGYAWAAEVADYIDLERLANLNGEEYRFVDLSSDDEVLLDVADSDGTHATLSAHRDCLDSVTFCIEEDDLVRPEFWEGFIEGAQRLFEEVSPQIWA